MLFFLLAVNPYITGQKGSELGLKFHLPVHMRDKLWLFNEKECNYRLPPDSMGVKPWEKEGCDFYALVEFDGEDKKKCYFTLPQVADSNVPLDVLMYGKKK